MTVESSVRKETKAGGQDSMDFSFKTLADHPEYIKLTKTLISTGVDTDLEYASDYTVAVTQPDGDGGTVTMTPSVSTLYTVTIYRDTSDVQESDYEDYNQFPADTVEEDFDRRTLIAQENKEELDRALKLSITAATGSNLTLADPEATTVIGWNAAADGLENYDNPVVSATLAGLYASTASTQAAAAAVSATAAGNYASTASTQAIAAATSATSALASEVSAGTYSTLAGLYASTASTQATSASGYATAAATSSTLAGYYATSASTSAVLSGLYASTASTQAIAAATSATTAVSASVVAVSASVAAAASAVEASSYALTAGTMSISNSTQVLKLEQLGNGAHLTLSGNPTVASPSHGNIWFNGTSATIRVGAVSQIIQTEEVAWTDYFSSSTIVGWAATPTGTIYYKKVGKLVFVNFQITGTSNATAATFTLPYTRSASGSQLRIPVSGADNGSDLTQPAMGLINANSNIFYSYPDWASGNWTASNAKVITGEFWYEATT